MMFQAVAFEELPCIRTAHFERIEWPRLGLLGRVIFVRAQAPALGLVFAMLRRCGTNRCLCPRAACAKARQHGTERAPVPSRCAPCCSLRQRFYTVQ